MAAVPSCDVTQPPALGQDLLGGGGFKAEQVCWLVLVAVHTGLRVLEMNCLRCLFHRVRYVTH